MIELLVTLLLFPLVGAAVAALLRLPLPASRPAALAFCWLTGLGANGTILYVLGTAGVPLQTVTFVAIPAVATAVLALRWRTLPKPARAERHLFAGAVMAVPLLVLLCAAAVLPTRDYDGRVTWLPKARAIALEGSVSGPFFQGERGLNLHNRYPLLMPLDAAVVMRLSGNTANEAARWLYVFIPFAALLVLRAFLIASSGAAGAWIAAAVAWLPVLASIEGGALAAYNDLALMAFFGIAVLSMPAAPRTTGLFAAFALLTKNEGAALAVALFVAAVVAQRRRPAVEWAGLVVPVAGAGALVAWWRTLVPAAYDEQYGALLPGAPELLHRVPEALRALATHAVEFSEWGVFWVVFAVAVPLAARRAVVPLAAIAVALAAYVLALTVTSWNIADLAPVVANRLLSHLVMPAAWAIAEAAKQWDP